MTMFLLTFLVMLHATFTSADSTTTCVNPSPISRVNVVSTFTTTTLTWNTAPTATPPPCEVTYHTQIRTQNDDFTTYSEFNDIINSVTYTDHGNVKLFIDGLQPATVYHVSIQIICTNTTHVLSPWITIALRTPGLIRRPVASLLPQELSAYGMALLSLNALPETLEYSYRWFTQVHANAFDVTERAHNGPVFLPWHRRFLSMYESALRPMLDLTGSYDSQYGIIYWDWATDSSRTPPVPTPALGIIPFTKDFLGSRINATNERVLDGLFIYPKWQKLAKTVESDDTPYLLRSQMLSFNQSTGLGTSVCDHETIVDLFTANTFLEFANAWESCHNHVHRYVGGDMVPNSSPDEPAFYMHHAFVDKTWYDFQNIDPIRSNYTGTLPGQILLDDGSICKFCINKLRYDYTRSQQVDSQLIYVDFNKSLPLPPINQDTSSASLQLPINQYRIRDTFNSASHGTRYVTEWNPQWTRMWSNKPQLPKTLIQPGTSITWAAAYTVSKYTYTSYTTLTVTMNQFTSSAQYQLAFIDPITNEILIQSSTIVGGSVRDDTLIYTIGVSSRGLGSSITIALIPYGNTITTKPPTAHIGLTATNQHPTSKLTGTFIALADQIQVDGVCNQ